MQKLCLAHKNQGNRNTKKKRELSNIVGGKKEYLVTKDLAII